MFYKLSRLSKVHNFLRVMMNSILFLLPTSLKYWIGGLMRNSRPPYKLIRDGWMVVQVGAPWDLLKAGRSRSIHFSRRVGLNGRVIVIEADENNVKELNAFNSKYGINNITVVNSAAWSKECQLRFLIDDDHPASNLVEEVYDSSRRDRGKYREVMVNANSLDNILDSLHVDCINLISITSNGSEEEILQGLSRRASKIGYISIVGNPENFKTIKKYGFSCMSEDDRGLIYRGVGN